MLESVSPQNSRTLSALRQALGSLRQLNDLLRVLRFYLCEPRVTRILEVKMSVSTEANKQTNFILKVLFT